MENDRAVEGDHINLALMYVFRVRKRVIEQQIGQLTRNHPTRSRDVFMWAYLRILHHSETKNLVAIKRIKHASIHCKKHDS